MERCDICAGFNKYFIKWDNKINYSEMQICNDCYVEIWYETRGVMDYDLLDQLNKIAYKRLIQID